ncbi:YopJ Serine/Threonine acetyltransferase [Kosakonia sacchari]|nr:YopJ Serine/Threonine acetyltransferase [Kosakonia sacchari]
MPLYNATKGSSRFDLAKPSTSLQRKIRSNEFQRIKYAHSKYEARIDFMLPDAESMPDLCHSATESAHTLKSYLESSNNILFNQTRVSDSAFLVILKELERDIFPLVVNVVNNKNGSALRYEVKGMDIFNKIRFCTAGRKQFIFYDAGHAIYIDIFKDEFNNMSAITIDSLDDGMGWGSDFAEDLFKEFKNSGRLSALNLHTDVQKSELGCKFFSLHFARRAIKDPALIAQHIFNIENAKYLNKDTCCSLNNKETEQILNVNYYKHAQSSTRLKLMLPEKRNELLSDGKTLLQHHADFKVKKISPEKQINYSNSIDCFRRKQIEAAVRYYQESVKQVI